MSYTHRSSSSGMAMLNFGVTVIALLNISGLPCIGVTVTDPANNVLQDRDREPAANWKTLTGHPTALFAHRGEPALLPAHTLPGYELGAINGADYLEPDLFLTKDDVLVCFHDIFLKNSTDVETRPEFQHLKRSAISVESEDGVERSVDDWVIKDFTWEQLSTLRVRQLDVGIRSQYFNWHFGIPSFQQYLNLVHGMTVKLGRRIGIIPELKFPPFHNEDKAAPFHMEDVFLEIMQLNGYATKISPLENCTATINGNSNKISCPPVIIQSYHHETTKYLRNILDYELVQLLGIQLKYYTTAGLTEISKYAHWVGLWKEIYTDGLALELPTVDLTEVEASNIIDRAHQLGLKVTVFTIRDSREYTPTGNCTGAVCHFGTKEGEMTFFMEQGVDGLFVENMAEAAAIRARFGEILKAV